ncbi:MAG TPA: cold shock and DUF1294 domain-containing protein [Gammaproteobacteria bacterium]
MRYQGKITNWKDDKGFGFITPNGGGQPVFVHIKSFSNRQRRPVENENVTYGLKTNPNGRPQAESVAFVDERVPSATSFCYGDASFILVIAFLVFVAVSVFFGKLPIAILWLYLIASVITFLSYAHDKSAARHNQWRMQESTLHLFALVGGWPGALAAQRLLRHKSKKTSFQIVFWFTVLLNGGTLGWFFTSSGTEVLRSIFGTA